MSMSPIRFRSSIVALLAGSSLSAASARAQAPAMGMEEAIALSVKQTPAVRSAAAGVVAAERKAEGTSVQRLPKLRAEANVLRWNKRLLIPFGPMDPVTGMPTTGDALLARDLYTTSAVLSLSQPISGLFVIGRAVAVQRSAVAGAQAEVGQARLDAAQRTADAYLGVLQAVAAADVAEKAVAQMDAQLARAQTQETAGVLGRVDVLRLISARDAARQSHLKARTDVQVARGRLALALHLPPEEAPAVVDDLPDPPEPPVLTEDEWLQAAASERPELVAAAERRTQARGNRVVAMAEWLPNIMGIAQYQHITGQGPFQPKNAWYVGATLTWDIWDWGKIHKGVKEAEARVVQADLAHEALQRQILTEARQRLLEAQAAFAQLEPARTSLEAATEAHRIQTVRYEQGVASTTDIIDAELDLARARNGYAQARYGYYQAQAALARAAGAMPDPRSARPRR